MQLKLQLAFEPKNVLPKNGEALYFPQFFTAEESDRYYKIFLNNAPWKQETLEIYEKEIPQPRLIAWYPNLEQKYFNSPKQSNELLSALLEIKRRIEAVSKKKFNCALLNQYRNGKDGVGWHRDKELGNNPIIGSVTFGATRSFQLKHTYDQNLKVKIDLCHGDFLLMQGTMQHYWLHSIRKTKKPVGIRINITFRAMII